MLINLQSVFYSLYQFNNHIKIFLNENSPHNFGVRNPFFIDRIAKFVSPINFLKYKVRQQPALGMLQIEFSW